MGNVNYDPTVVGAGGGYGAGGFGGIGGIGLVGLVGINDLGRNDRNDNCGCAEYGQFAAVNQNITNGAYTISSEIATGNQFTNTNLQNGFNNLSTLAVQNTGAIAHEISENTGEITEAIFQGTLTNTINSLNGKYDLAQAMNAMSAEMTECCCETKQAIAATNLTIVESKYQAEIANEARYNALSKQGTAETQTILSKLCDMQAAALQDTIAELRSERDRNHASGAVTAIVNQLGIGNSANDIASAIAKKLGIAS